MAFDICKFLPWMCNKPTPGVPSTPTPPGNFSGMEVRILTLTNELRAANGVSPLVWSDELAYAAHDWSYKQSLTGIISHLGFPFARSLVIKAKYPGSSVSVRGENVAMFTGLNSDPAKTLVDMWEHSPGHRANMLNSGFTKLGAGIASGWATFGTQIFGN